MAAGPASYQLKVHQPRQLEQTLAKASVRLYKTKQIGLLAASPFARRPESQPAKVKTSPWLNYQRLRCKSGTRPQAHSPPLLLPHTP